MARRILITAVVLLTIGAIMNIAVAWACVVGSRQRDFNARRLGQVRSDFYDEMERLENAGTPMEADIYLAALYESTGTRVLVIEERVEGSRWPIKRNQHDAGWPMLSMRAIEGPNEHGNMQAMHGAKAGKMHLAFPPLQAAAMAAIPPAARPAFPGARSPAQAAVPVTPAVARVVPTSDRLLPLRPLWPGFAINAMLYAVVAWLAWMLFVSAMHLQRRIRGLCGRCAYPIGVSFVCTECGREVRVKIVAAR